MSVSGEGEEDSAPEDTTETTKIIEETTESTEVTTTSKPTTTTQEVSTLKPVERGVFDGRKTSTGAGESATEKAPDTTKGLIGGLVDKGKDAAMQKAREALEKALKDQNLTKEQINQFLEKFDKKELTAKKCEKMAKEMKLPDDVKKKIKTACTAAEKVLGSSAVVSCINIFLALVCLAVCLYRTRWDE